MSRNIKIIIIEEYKMKAQAFSLLFKKQPGITVVKFVDKIENLTVLLAEENIDIVITDLDFRDMDGLEKTRELLKDFPNIKIIALTSIIKPLLIEFAISLGLKGFISKHESFEKLIEVIQIVFHGGSVYPHPFTHLSQTFNHTALVSLSKREKQVAGFILSGRTASETGIELGISIKTVESHRSNIYRKLDVTCLQDLKELTTS